MIFLFFFFILISAALNFHRQIVNTKNTGFPDTREVKQENKTITTDLTITPASRLDSNPHF